MSTPPPTPRALKATSNTTQPLVFSQQAITSLPSQSFPDPKRGSCSWQTIISGQATPTNSFTMGLASCPPRTSSCEGFLAPHRHEQAEIYHIMSGRGIVKIDGVDFPVTDGDVVFIPGDAEHEVWNLDEKDELRWLYVFAADDFQNIVYRFSGEHA